MLVGIVHQWPTPVCVGGQLVMVIGSACLLITQLDTHVLPIAFTIEREVIIEDIIQSLLNVSFWCFLTKPHIAQI